MIPKATTRDAVRWVLPDRIAWRVIIIFVSAGILLTYTAWRAEFERMQWFMLFLAEGAIALLAAVPVVAAAIIHLFGKRWRRAVSTLAGVVAAPLILTGGLLLPPSVRFLASQPHYLSEIARVPRVDSTPMRLEWLIDPAPDGEDVSVMYNEAGGGGSGSLGNPCALYIKPIRGWFYLKSIVCRWD